MATGLSTGLKPTFGLKTANHCSANLEGFLTAVGKPLPREVFRHRRFELPNKKLRETYEVLQKLKRYRSVCVPTDKTNSTRVIQINEYKSWVSDHLLKVAKIALCLKAIALFEDANKLIKKVKMSFSVQVKICEIITHNAINAISKYNNQRPQDNQRRKGIPNQVGN